MPSKNTFQSGAWQASSSLGAADTAAVLGNADRARRKRDWLACVRSTLRSETGRLVCKDQHVSPRLVEDLAGEFVHGPYPSLWTSGDVYPSQKRLAGCLDADERQIRRAVAVLVALNLLRVVRERRGRRHQTNRMVPLLSGSPLFDRIGLVNNQRTCATSMHRTSASSDQGTQAPSNSCEEESKKDSSSVGPSASASTDPSPPSEVEEIDLEEIEIGASAASQQAQSRSSTCRPSGVKLDEDTQPSSKVVNFGFARLMSDYPHPPGQLERGAYEPHARRACAELSPAQVAEATRAARQAPGKKWLGHWLNDGRETGKFEVLEEPVAVVGAPQVWVAQDTPQWAAWVEQDRANGRCRPKTQYCVQGEMQTGWWFESEWPSGAKGAKCSGEAP